MPTYDAQANEINIIFDPTGTQGKLSKPGQSQTFFTIGVPSVRHGVNQPGKSVVPVAVSAEARATVNRVAAGKSSVVIAFDAKATYGKQMDARGSSEIRFKVGASICSAAYGLSVGDAISKIIAVWNSGGCAATGACGANPVAEEAVEKLNAAFQALYASGKVHGWIAEMDIADTMTIESYPVGDLIPSIYLPKSAQSIAGPVIVSLEDGEGNVLESIALRPLVDRDGFEMFSREYADSTWTVHPMEVRPLAYWVSSFQPQVAGLYGSETTHLQQDGLWIRIAPPIKNLNGGAVDGTYGYSVRVTLKPPRFSCNDPGFRLPVPLEHAETLLLPLARYYAMSSRYFTGKDALRESILEQAKGVLTLLGEMAPEPKEAA